MFGHWCQSWGFKSSFWKYQCRYRIDLKAVTKWQVGLTQVEMTFQWKIRYEVCRYMKSWSFHTLTASFIETCRLRMIWNLKPYLALPYRCSWIKFLVPLRLMHTWPSPGPAENCVSGGKEWCKWVSPSALQYVPDCKGGWLHGGSACLFFKWKSHPQCYVSGIQGKQIITLQKSCFVWKWNERPEYIDAKYVLPQIVFFLVRFKTMTNFRARSRHVKNLSLKLMAKSITIQCSA